jgi:Transposase
MKERGSAPREDRVDPDSGFSLNRPSDEEEEEAPMDRQDVGIDFHRRRSVVVRMSATGEKLSSVRILNDPLAISAAVAEAGSDPEVVVGATYGWYWVVDLLQASGARVHLANPQGLNWGQRRVKNDERDAIDLADMLRLGRLPEAWIAPPAVRGAAGAGALPGQARRSLCTDDQTGEAPPVESVGIRQSRRRRDSHGAFAVREREDHLLGVVWEASEKRVVREHGIAAVHTDAADVVRHHAIHEPLV